MTAASDQRNPCPQSCWLSSDHLTLLAANKSDWFRDGIFVAKFHTSSSYIHFQPNGCVSETCTLLPARAPCVLGLMTRKSFHFVLARPCPYSNSQRVSSSVGSSCGSVLVITHLCSPAKMMKHREFTNRNEDQPTKFYYDSLWGHSPIILDSRILFSQQDATKDSCRT